MVESKYQLNLPENHLDILRIVSAMAWADGNLTEEESELLINQFNEDLPPKIEPLVYMDDTPPLFFDVTDSGSFSHELLNRITAELALKEIIVQYKYNPIPLAILVEKLKTEEDKSLALKLAYMVIKISPDEKGKIITLEEKKAYRQLVNLLGLKDDLVKEIELQAEEDLDEFQHPFQAFLHKIKKTFTQEI